MMYMGERPRSTEGVKLSGTCEASRNHIRTQLWRVPYGRRRCTDALRSLSLRQKDRAQFKYKGVFASSR